MEHALKRFRIRTGTKSSQIAEAAGTSRQSIYRIENWSQSPTLEMVKRLIDATGGELSADDFILRSEASQ